MLPLTQTDILQGAAAAAEEAERLGIHVATAIMDASGNLLGFLRMPKSFLASIEYAQWKAWTAVSFGTPTIEFSRFLEGTPPLVREGLLAHAKVTPLPGGLPIVRSGGIIGAIGVSGGTGDQDELCAVAGLRAIGAHDAATSGDD